MSNPTTSWPDSIRLNDEEYGSCQALTTEALDAGNITCVIQCVCDELACDEVHADTSETSLIGSLRDLLVTLHRA